MRYKAEKRTTFLYAENFQSNDKTKGGDSNSPGSASAQGAKKAALPRKKAVQGGSDHPDGMFPKIEIVNGEGPATLIVSCVSYTEPHFVHPHRLIGDNCKSGVAVLNIGKGEKIFELVGVSIEFTKRHDIELSINELKTKNVDPFNAGFEFPRDKIDLTRVRLCFQVYLRDSLTSNTIVRDQYHILKPVLSNVVYNSSRKTTLQILRTANLSSPALGGRILTIFLKKLEKDQKKLSAKFFDNYGWSRTVEIHDFHYQCAVMLEAPPYKLTDIASPVRVNLKLFVPFKDDKEKFEFINKQQNEDNDDDFEDNEESGISAGVAATSSYSSSPSIGSTSQAANTSASFQSSSASALSSSMSFGSSSSQTEMFKEIPDGKYESRVLEFTYFAPEVSTSKRKLDTYGFYDFSEASEKDLTNEIGEESRSKLAKRQCEIIESEFNSKIPQVFQDRSMSNTVSYNFAMRHNTIANSMQIDRFQPSQMPPSLPSSSSVQFSDAVTSLNANPAELRELIDHDFQLEMAEILDQLNNNNESDAYSLENLITTLDSDNLDENLFTSSDMSNNDL